MRSILKLAGFGRSSMVKVAAAIAVSTIAGAIRSQAALVVPGSNFDLSIIGENATGSQPANQATYDPTNDTYLVNTHNYTFGSTQTFGAVTVSSSETVVGQVITDTISITDPTNFDPSGTMFNGSPIETIVFDLGEDAEITAGPVTQNGLNFTSAVNPAPAYFTDAGTATYSGGTISIATGVNFNGPDTSMFETQGVYLIPTLGDLAPYDFTNFTFTATQVPEPVSVGIFGVAAGFGLLRRRRV